MAKKEIYTEIKQWRKLKKDEFQEIIEHIDFKGKILCTNKEMGTKMLISDLSPINKSIQRFLKRDIESYIKFRENELIRFFIKELNKSGKVVDK